MEKIGFAWHTDNDNSSYIADEIVQVKASEADAYYEAANELYDMYVNAAQHVIDNNLFHEIGIPFNLVDSIKKAGKMTFTGTFMADLILLVGLMASR